MTRAEDALRADLEERLRFEALLADISARFVHVPADEVDQMIEEAQRRIGRGAGRPLAKDPDLFGLFIRRRRWYGRATHRIWTEGLTVDEVVDALLRLL